MWQSEKMQIFYFILKIRFSFQIGRAKQKMAKIGLFLHTFGLRNLLMLIRNLNFGLHLDFE